MQKTKTRIKDRIWLWGQDPGTHHEQGSDGYKLPGTNKMDSMEGCIYFDIPNCCRVEVCGKPVPPFEKEAEALKTLDRVVWSVLGAGHTYNPDSPHGDLDEVIHIAKLYPNIVGGVFDDFFSSERMKHFTPELLAEIRKHLHSDAGRKLDLWAVLYTHQLDLEIKPYLDEFDVITLWTWSGKDLYHIDENFAKYFKLTPNKRHLAGLYMWNYGEKMPLTREQMDIQFDNYYKMMKNGSIEGVIICSNCIADLGIEAVEWTKQWLKEIGDETI